MSLDTLDAENNTPAQIDKTILPFLITITNTPTVSYAAVQNLIPIIQSIRIENTSDVDLKNIELLISANPPFILGQRFCFELFRAGEIRVLKADRLELQPDHAYFSGLNEAELGYIEVRVKSHEAETCSTNPVQLLAHNEWGGTRGLPELLAAFVQPNSLAVDRLLGLASAILKKSDISLSLDGYQSKNRERVWKQISAIFGILSMQDIQYGPPPASFESTGQKIRGTDRILDARISTCLDSAVLMASCFEQAGLNPVIAFKEGHAWVGVWLVDNCFSTPIVDCVQSVRKRVDSGELLMLEATAITQASHPSMQWARNNANIYLEESSTTFTYAVDIKRARLEHIRALKEKSHGTEQTSGDENAAQDAKQYAIEDMPALPPLDPGSLPITEITSVNTPQDRLTRWKNKLLDLTLRNKLLNFKPGKSFLKLICSNPNLLEDALNSEKEFKLTSKPLLMENQDPRSAELFFKDMGMTPIEAHAQTVLTKQELVFDVPTNEFNPSLTDIYRSGKNALEETGANTLYLSIGMLYWKESVDAEVVLKAPLLLIPVILKRGAIGAGIRLSRHDDETIFNPTLIQKLALAFEIRLPFIDGQLPTDEKGLNVDLIFQQVRMAVAELNGFEVRPDCYLGNFSFTKYVMWKDLSDRLDDLSKSQVVNHLINNVGQSFVDDYKAVVPKDLDDVYSPKSLFIPLIADSSQLAVICSASLGKNIVVEGPPGTGKSQTITNMIAHFLASGNTVLFVAEKMAALEVVYQRLSQLGLHEFCLELHSSKAKKSQIAQEFVQTLNNSQDRLPSDWENEAEKLSCARNHLNDLVKVLHQRHRNGLSVYEAMGICIANSNKVPASLPWLDADIHDTKELSELTKLVEEMSALAGQLENIAEHPLSAIGQVSWTPSWQDQLIEKCKSLEISIKVLVQELTEFSKCTMFEQQRLSLRELMALDKLAESLMQACEISPQSVTHAHQQDSRQRLQNLIAHGIARNQTAEKLKDYSPNIKKIDAQEWWLQWQAAKQSRWPKSWYNQRKVISQIRLYHVKSLRLKADKVEEFLNTLSSLNREDKYISENTIFAQETLGAIFNDDSTNWEVAQLHLDWMENFTHSLTEVYQNRIEELTSHRSKLKILICEQPEMFAAGSPYFNLAVNLRVAYREFLSLWDDVLKLITPRTELFCSENTPGILISISSMVASWQNAKSQLQRWCVWQSNKSNAYTHGLQDLVARLERGEVPLGELSNFFDFSYKSWWLKKIIDREPLLANFSGATHENKISEFKKIDEKFQQLTQSYIVAKLRGQIPSESEISGDLRSEVAFLRREAQKKKQHKSIREIIKQSHNLWARLKPCLLMSPLSAAQYLDATYTQFDVVIFDEASQIPTWDAVGAIARGKQLICVGDPKQLPPTNFFNSTDLEGIVDENDIEEMESILDECLSIGMTPCTLNWHYRSKSEGLITFSNMQYYDNRLITFPSPTTQDKSVKFEWIDGIYDSGKSRTNHKEAAAIVEAIAEHYLSGKGKELSVGVITFNAAQEALINRLLDAKRLKSYQLDCAILDSLVEPLLIKNLENVQGNERDIILFSTTFGKDLNGKISMNFGPMNKEGGYRRLNVAASRARCEVRIFSSLRPEHIDLSRTKARGVADLKAYLDFAINGPGALLRQALPTGREPDSPFELEVMNMLRNHGWEVHPQVGVSGYRIDLGIVNPHARGSYLLGIECDGATYHSAASARDRDRLRQMILEGLGWKIHRIWSTDWWLNSGVAMQKLLERLSRLEKEAAGGNHDVGLE